MSSQHAHPLEILSQMEQDVVAADNSLPEEAAVAEQWVGLSYKVGDMEFVTTMEQVSEVVPSASLSIVPRTQSWLRGIANVRGRLLTVIDLQDFLGMEPVVADQYSPHIVNKKDHHTSCFFVSRLQGFRHFDPVGDSCETGELNPEWAGYISGALSKGKQKWLVFDADKLVDEKGFLNAAA
jgi:twitching motility protein PilI